MRDLLHRLHQALTTSPFRGVVSDAGKRGSAEGDATDILVAEADLIVYGGRAVKNRFGPCWHPVPLPDGWYKVEALQ